MKVCHCAYGPRGLVEFGSCPQCGKRQLSMRWGSAPKWGVWCSAAERSASPFVSGLIPPRYTARTRAEARALVSRANRECATPGSRHVVRRLP